MFECVMGPHFRHRSRGQGAQNVDHVADHIDLGMVEAVDAHDAGGRPLGSATQFEPKFLGRIEKACPIDEGSRHPIHLDRKHALVQLVPLDALSLKQSRSMFPSLVWHPERPQQTNA